MDYDEKEMSLGIICGVIVGVVITSIIWAFVADAVECSKVDNGYLTFKNVTYEVTLYDVLDTPDSKE